MLCAVPVDFQMRECTLAPNSFNLGIIFIILLFFFISIHVIDKIILRISYIWFDLSTLVVSQGLMDCLILSLIMRIEAHARNTDRSCISVITLWVFIFVIFMLSMLSMRTMRCSHFHFLHNNYYL